MIDSLLSEQHLMTRKGARKFAESELGPIARQIDDEQTFPMEVYRKAGQLGFIGTIVPLEYGGESADLLTAAIIKEELCRVAAGFGISFNICALNYCHFISVFGTEEQKRQYLPPVLSGEKLGCYALTEPEAGSDALSIRTFARREGDYYVINGSKTFATNAPIAEHFILVARTQDGRGSGLGTNFLLDRDMPGLEVGKKMDKMGMRCSPTGEIFLDSVKVHRDQILGSEGSGFPDMFNTLDAERALQACTSLGIAQAAYEAAVKYTKERVQFGRPIAEFQLVKQLLADMCVGIDTSRCYAYQVIKWAGQGKKATKEVAISAQHASRVATKTTQDAVQIYGGYGFIKDYDVERYFRDAKLGEIGGGTNQIKTLIIARELLKGGTGG